MCCWADRITGRDEAMKKAELIAAIQKEILRHEFSTFVDEPPVSSKGGGRLHKQEVLLTPALVFSKIVVAAPCHVLSTTAAPITEARC
jgi:hypothetical protein